MVVKTMWNRRFRLFIGTKGGNVLRGLHLRFSRLGPAGTFSTVPHVPCCPTAIVWSS
jgi:hypothetical protein